MADLCLDAGGLTATCGGRAWRFCTVSVVLQYLDRKILRITEAATEHIVVRALGSNTDRADRHFKARVLAHLRSKVRQAAASAQTKRMADLN